MKVCMQQFLGTNHSWRCVGLDIAKALIRSGNDLDLCSTNGYEHFPKELEQYKVDESNIKSDYDMQISYTAMINFPRYLSHGIKNRFAIWNYETTVLPPGFCKFYKACDKMLPSSNFSYDVFLKNGIPADHMVVIPHGINIEEYSNKEKFKLKTKKRLKILANIAQPHIRKNIPALFEAWGKAFNNKDDVCLVVKVAPKNIDKRIDPNTGKIKNYGSEFDVDFWKIYNDFKKKYKNHAEIELITNFFPSLVPLYNACDAIFTMTYAECFWMPGLEGMACGCVPIAPRYGGQLDFLNDNNSLLIDGKMGRAIKELQYWTQSPHAEVFYPDIDRAAELLKDYYNKTELIRNRFYTGMQEKVKELTWDNVAKRIIELT